MLYLRGLLMIAAILVAANSWGYGSGGGGSSACDKPLFGHFEPPNHSEVAPGSQFSFVVSRVKPDSIQVTVKGEPVEISVAPKGGGFLVVGELPQGLKDTFARINITASGPDRCKGADGWLLKITK